MVFPVLTWLWCQTENPGDIGILYRTRPAPRNIEEENINDETGEDYSGLFYVKSVELKTLTISYLTLKLVLYSRETNSAIGSDHWVWIFADVIVWCSTLTLHCQSLSFISLAGAVVWLQTKRERMYLLRISLQLLVSLCLPLSFTSAQLCKHPSVNKGKNSSLDASSLHSSSQVWSWNEF